MTTEERKPSELDLLAYADGFLDDDPGRKAEIERYLAEDSETAARLRDYAAQNEEIRAAFAHRLEEPVPERHHRLFDEPPRRSPHGLVQAAAAVVAVLCAGLVGWWIGYEPENNNQDRIAFIEQATTRFLASEVGNSEEVRALAAGRTLDWLSDTLALELRAPNLAGLGATLVDRRVVADDGRQAAELVYRMKDGTRVSLFLRSRWQESEPEIHAVENKGAVAAYWREGPLAYALVGPLDREAMAALARDVRNSALPEPQIEPARETPHVTVQGEGIACAGPARPDDPACQAEAPTTIRPIGTGVAPASTAN